jgi:hypothetical protein
MAFHIRAMICEQSLQSLFDDKDFVSSIAPLEEIKEPQLDQNDVSGDISSIPVSKLARLIPIDDMYYSLEHDPEVCKEGDNLLSKDKSKLEPSQGSKTLDKVSFFAT